MNDIDLQYRTSLIIRKLQQHPAYALDDNSSICSGVIFYLSPCDENGITDEEARSDDEYIKKYQKDWCVHHVEYHYHVTFFIYADDPYSPSPLEYTSYQRYQGFEGFALTFDDMVVDIWENTKKHFGDFDINSFLTTQEREILDKRLDAIFEDISKNDTITSEMLAMPFSDRALSNQRWVKWLMGTEYFKTNWQFNETTWRNLIGNV